MLDECTDEVNLTVECALLKPRKRPRFVRLTSKNYKPRIYERGSLRVCPLVGRSVERFSNDAKVAEIDE